jgi:hypothetical protein
VIALVHYKYKMIIKTQEHGSMFTDNRTNKYNIYVLQNINSFEFLPEYKDSCKIADNIILHIPQNKLIIVTNINCIVILPHQKLIGYSMSTVIIAVQISWRYARIFIVAFQRQMFLYFATPKNLAPGAKDILVPPSRGPDYASS